MIDNTNIEHKVMNLLEETVELLTQKDINKQKMKMKNMN
jgi:hypothetical protein